MILDLCFSIVIISFFYQDHYVLPVILPYFYWYDLHVQHSLSYYYYYLFGYYYHELKCVQLGIIH